MPCFHAEATVSFTTGQRPSSAAKAPGVNAQGNIHASANAHPAFTLDQRETMNLPFPAHAVFG